MTGLVGAAATAEAKRLAGIHDISWKHIYGMTKDLRPQRKKRSDAGRRKFDIVEGTDTFEVAKLVVGAKLDPDQALLTAKANGAEKLPSLPTMQRLLRERLGTRKQRNSGKRSHRRFEAESPLDMIQIDCTALKVRWQDIKTRRILRIEGIDKNHPQLDQGKIRVWQIMAVDDHTRRRYLKYIVTSHITSKDMVAFCCELFCEWGLPLKVYTDNGPEFKGFFTKSVEIISRISSVRDTGGYEHLKHTPGNSQASGKVEVAHIWAEKMDRYIGLAIEKGMEVTADKLHSFAEAICRQYNEVQVNRTTGQTPLARWSGQRILTRMLPREVIKSALLFDEAVRVLNDTWTVRVANVDYRIPSGKSATGEKNPFRVGMKLTVIVPHEHDEIFVSREDGGEWAIPKVIANADAALDWKTLPDTEAEELAKRLKAGYKQSNREAKERKKLTNEVYQVPHFNHEIATPATNVASFPQPKMAISADEVSEASPATVSVPPAVAGSCDSANSATRSTQSTPTGKPVTYWECVAEFQDRFVSKDECKQFLRGIFVDDTATMPVTEVEAIIDGRNQKEVASIRLAG